MPANLTPDYLAAEQRFREAKTVADKIECLEEMLSTIPKHKGTDHLQADLKRRLSKLREQAQSKKTHGERFQPWRIERQGAGQVVILGPPNSGKSSLLAALTNAHPVVAAYPFSTQLPQPGMMDYEDVQVQLVDTPPITSDFMEPWMGDLLRRADAAVLVADLLSDDLLESIEVILSRLEKVRVFLSAELPPHREPINVHRRCRLVANKADTIDATDRLALLQEFIGDRFPLLAISACPPPLPPSPQVGEGLGVGGLEELRLILWRLLGVIRVYSKPPGQKPDLKQPYVVPTGSTLIELAAHVHKDFASSLRHARVWGADGGAGSARFPGQPVERDHIMQDRDVVELRR